MLVLTVLQGPDKGRKFELPDHEPQLIGRSSEALPITDTTVSRRHAELTPDNGAWFIRDLASQNGTYVNGVRIAERTRLRPGDQVRVGSSLFVFGATESRDPEVVRFLRPGEIESSVERSLASQSPAFGLARAVEGDPGDSVILSEPEPRAAAVDHLRVIYRLTTILASRVTERQDLLRAVLDLVFAEFRPERGFVLLLDPGEDPRGENPAFTPATVKYAHAPRDPEEAAIHVSRTIIQHVLRHAEGVLSSNAMSDPRFASGDSVQRFAIRSAICAPITFRERTFGVLYVDSSIANYTYTPEQLALMNAIGQHVGLALANAEMYAEKLQSERLAAIGETMASLSHSIKNILQGMRGGADVVELAMKKEDLKVARGGWAILKRNLDRIMSLTLNMLAYSRQRKPEIELTRLGAVLDECAALMEGPCAARQVALLVDADAEIPPLPLDGHLMHQAIMNLLTNAVEAAPERTGAVTVRASYHAADPRRHAPGWAEITIIDNGPGIPRDRLPLIFLPFFSTKGLRGTGLGLAVARRIVDEHGGRIEVESEGGGKGSTFRVILPVDGSAVIDPSATASDRPTKPEFPRSS